MSDVTSETGRGSIRNHPLPPDSFASMTVDNIEEIKTALAALKERQAPRRRGRIRALHGGVPDPQETQAAAAAATAGISARRRALSMLDGVINPDWYYVTLDAFLSNEQPGAALGLVQENGTSFMKIYFDSHHNDSVSLEGGAATQFYFAWKNPSDSYVVASASSALSLNGYAYAAASNGNFAQLGLTAYLDAWRFSGWGTDNSTGDGTQYPIYGDVEKFPADLITCLDCANGFPATMTVPFYADAPFVLTTGGPQIAIPGGASLIFEVGLIINWQFFTNTFAYQTTEDQPQEVRVDLANDESGYIIQCPTLELGVLALPTQHHP
jgi:hypothetical protein